MPKIERDNCGRKVTVNGEGQESHAPMRYYRRCGEELSPRKDW
ncbi:hypothetical protein [Haladaptatus halobius]|nr:hypothetical protein [Haladaptatus halobius]